VNDFTKVDWEIKSLGDVCETVSTGPFGSLLGKKDYVASGIPLVNPIDIVDDVIRSTAIKRVTTETANRLNSYRMQSGDIVVARRGELGRCAKVTDQNDGWLCGTGSFFLRPKEFVSTDYLVRYIRSPASQAIFEAASTGATMPNISNKTLSKLPIPVPPLEEQQRIVAVLDEAFEGLARARAHAEVNLRNARELFTSALREALQTGRTGWRTLTVADTLTRTKVPAKIQRKAYLPIGAFPIVSQEAELINGYWNKECDVIHVTRPIVVFGDHTRALKYIDFDFVVGADGTQIMAAVECLEPRFYYYALKTIDLAGKGYARHFSHFKKCEISFPVSIEAQQGIATWLDELSASVKYLESQYIRALQDLDDLRQSLLKNAFAGKLT
jgi:hypothetical protein